jgi:hypothetical protein
MRIWISACVILAVCLATSAFAPGAQHFGPFASTSPDGSSCGPAWANDTFDRSFTVQAVGSGVFKIHEDFKNGSFVTIAGQSPGACSNAQHHGQFIAAGVNGSFQGIEEITASGGTFNPNGCATPMACNTTAGFLSAVFPGAAISVDQYNFEYSSSDNTLSFRHWQDKFDKQTGGDKFEGDIANN